MVDNPILRDWYHAVADAQGALEALNRAKQDLDAALETLKEKQDEARELRNILNAIVAFSLGIPEEIFAGTTTNTLKQIEDRLNDAEQFGG